MKVLIKKFNLLRDGVNYPAGSIVELPDAEAVALAKGAPKEFELLQEPAPIKSEPVPEETMDLEKLSVNELKKFAKENGIDVGDATKKQDVLNAIYMAIDEEATADGALPEADLAGSIVK